MIIFKMCMPIVGTSKSQQGCPTYTVEILCRWWQQFCASISGKDRQQKFDQI